MYVIMVKGKKYYVDVSDSDAVIRKVETMVDTEIDDLPDFDEIEEAVEQTHAVKAVLPSRICKILAQKGDHVRQNDVLFLCEAMKMELEVRTAEAGIVSDILVMVGDHVEKDQTLMYIDAQ